MVTSRFRQPEAPCSHRIFPGAARLSEMDKKEIESPKLTANFLLWIGLFLLAMFLLIAHFAWHLF
jgi:hypothetical protein